MAAGSPPVFSPEERVATPSPAAAASDLPKELEGKSPSEIFRIMQDRENQLRTNFATELQRQQKTPKVEPAPKKEPSRPSTIEFWQDPQRAIQTSVSELAVSREQFERESEPARRNMIETAKMITAQKFPDFKRFESDIQAIIDSLEPHLRIDPQFWQVAYFQVKGIRSDQLAAEAAARAKMPAELVNPPITPPPPPVELSDREKHIADKMGIDHETLKKGKVMYEQNRWPLTMDNVERIVWKDKK